MGKPYRNLSLLGKELLIRLLLDVWRSLPLSMKRRAKTLVSQLEARWPGRTRRLQVQRARFARELRQLLAQHETAQDVIIFAPSARWHWPLFQRPHQLALAFARLGCLVFFCEPPYSADYGAGFHRIDRGLYVANVSLEIFQAIESPIVFFLSYPRLNLTGLRSPRCVYDYIDELEVFPDNRQVLEQNHQRLLGAATLVIATAERLWRKVVASRPDVLLCPNGVDYPFIRRTLEATWQPPDDLAHMLRSAAPVIGYYGALAEWFDYGLLRQAAAERPQYEFVLIGPDYDRSLSKSRITDVKNIHWLGVRPYPQLPHYLKYFDVAIIPFKLNEITHSTSPIKLFEYMAAGKPVVTTAMHESSRCEGVIVTKGLEDFVCKLDEALQRRTDPEYLSLIDRLARENTWDARAQQILEALSVSDRQVRPYFEA